LEEPKVGEKEKKPKEKKVKFAILIRESFLLQIDELLEERVGMSKTAWILEAIQEKFKRSR
jgi:hypothetical protein